MFCILASPASLRAVISCIKQEVVHIQLFFCYKIKCITNDFFHTLYTAVQDKTILLPVYHISDI